MSMRARIFGHLNSIQLRSTPRINVIKASHLHQDRFQQSCSFTSAARLDKDESDCRSNGVSPNIELSQPFLSKSLTQISDSLNSGELTSDDLLKSTLKQVDSSKHFNAFIHTSDRQLLLEQAQESDERRRQNKSLSKFDGIPISVKDNINVKSSRFMTCGSRHLSNYQSPFDATVVRKCQTQSGMIIIGKTNMDEFGMGSHLTHSHFGRVVNPHSSTQSAQTHSNQFGSDDALSSGGSSGGSAASVSSGQCFASIGSDTGGSVRLPASYNRLVGYKPTYGRLSRYGLTSYVSSMDTVGLLTRTVRDAYEFARVCEGSDVRHDSTSQQRMQLSNADFTKSSDQPLMGVTIGIPFEFNTRELSSSVRSAWFSAVDKLSRLGARCVTCSLPSTRLALPIYYILSTAEAHSNLSRYDGVRFGYNHSKHLKSTLKSTAASKCDSKTLRELIAVSDAHSLADHCKSNRTQSFGEEMRRRILTGGFMLSSESYAAYYEKASQLRQILLSEYQSLFNEQCVDLVLTPTSTSTPPTFAQLSRRTLVEQYMDDQYTVIANLCGLPAISVPVVSSPSSFASREQSNVNVNDDLIGLQLMSNWNGECERETDAHFWRTAHYLMH